jgi:two-component system, sensor histidine kinase and response regulator
MVISHAFPHMFMERPFVMKTNQNSFSPPWLILRVLLADGSSSTPPRMVPMLEKLGHTVVRVHSNSQALEHLQQQHFDLLLIDAQTSQMDGMATTAAIRTQEKVLGGHVPIVAMSAHTMQADRIRCLASGMDRYTAKPFNTAELQTILLAFSDPDSIHRTNRPANWNRRIILERAGGDEKALSNLVETFIKEKSNLLEAMNRALLHEQAELLERTALQFVEQLSYLGAFEMSRTARELALSGKRRNFIKAGELALALQSLLPEIDAAMSRSNP